VAIVSKSHPIDYRYSIEEIRLAWLLQYCWTFYYSPSRTVNETRRDALMLIPAPTSQTRQVKVVLGNVEQRQQHASTRQPVNKSIRIAFPILVSAVMANVKDK
jgi:thiosulfate reductase cytochrome b subunit